MSVGAECAEPGNNDEVLKTRRIFVPGNRMTPVKNNWLVIFTPLVEKMMLQVRMNLRTHHIEIRESKYTEYPDALQKGADFVNAVVLGFEIDDALSLLRMDDIYIDSFEVRDVKTLHGDHLSRAIGRLAGKDGKTRFAIENATRTRIVIANTKISILGTFRNIRAAKDALMCLIMGSPIPKVYSRLKGVSSRLRDCL